jgi:glutathione synthase/RimK-type ligase-like ATP-grasp enzyme
MTFVNDKPFGIVYNYPVEYNALAAELWRRDIPLSLINPSHLSFDPSERRADFSLVLNDLSHPSGFHPDESFIRAMTLYTKHLESGPLQLAQGRVINGSTAIEILTSRVRQVSLFASVGVKYPKTIFANSLDALVRQLPSLRFPILIKEESHASRKPTLKFNSVNDFIDSIFSEQLVPGHDLLVVQEYLEPQTDHIIRVDVLNGLAISSRKIHTLRDPAADWALELKAEPIEPSQEVLRSIEQVVRAGKIDLATVEYFIDRQSGEPVFFNIAPFHYSRRNDPEARTLQAIGDYVERRLRKIREIELAI